MTQMRTIESVPFAKELTAALATPGTDAMRVAEDFFGLADLFKENTRLARAATDPARSVADKQGLASSAFGSHVTAATLSVVNAIVADHWRHPADVADTLEVLGILGVLNAAGAEGALEQVREELFQVRYFLAHHREVRVRLSDTSKGDAHERGDVASKLFASASAPGRCVSCVGRSDARTTVVCCTTCAATPSGQRPCRTVSSSRSLRRPR